MLDIRVRVVLDRIVVSFWCQSHGGPAHCLWSASQTMGAGGPDEFTDRVAFAAREFSTRVVRLQLDDLTDDCLA
jgi:hypothetical protein